MKKKAQAVVFRTCTKCGRRRALHNFRAEKRTKLGKSAVCDICHADYMRVYMKAYRAKARKAAKRALAQKAVKRAVAKKKVAKKRVVKSPSRR